MEQPTHYLTVTLGIDFAKVFSPERIQGVKFLLGVQSDEEVINALSSNILLDIESSLSKHKDFAKIAGVDLNQATVTPDLIEDSVDIVDDSDSLDKDYENEQVEDESAINSNETSEEYLNLDDLELEASAEDEMDDEDEDEDEDSSLLYDSYGIALVDNISNDVFKIEAFLGKVTNIFLKDYSYKDTVENEFGEDITVYSFETLKDLNEAISDAIEEDYVIRFKDQQGNIKFGKRKIDKE